MIESFPLFSRFCRKQLLLWIQNAFITGKCICGPLDLPLDLWTFVRFQANPAQHKTHIIAVPHYLWPPWTIPNMACFLKDGGRLHLRLQHIKEIVGMPASPHLLPLGLAVHSLHFSSLCADWLREDFSDCIWDSFTGMNSWVNECLACYYSAGSNRDGRWTERKIVSAGRKRRVLKRAAEGPMGCKRGSWVQR